MSLWSLVVAISPVINTVIFAIVFHTTNGLVKVYPLKVNMSVRCKLETNQIGIPDGNDDHLVWHGIRAIIEIDIDKTEKLCCAVQHRCDNPIILI